MTECRCFKAVSILCSSAKSLTSTSFCELARAALAARDVSHLYICLCSEGLASSDFSCPQKMVD